MLRWVLPLVLCAGVAAATAQQQKPKPTPVHAGQKAEVKAVRKLAKGEMSMTAERAKSVLGFTLKGIDGKDVSLSKYGGKVLLIVNVASKCGLTPQYEQLQTLHDTYAEKGLAILGFPANEFGGQEPGTNAEIKRFCASKYGVKFDMFAKVVVTGEGQCELYKFLTSKERDPRFAGEIRWNFTKFLVDRKGKVINRFEPKVRPDDPQVIKAIETALEAKPAEPSEKRAGGD